MDRLCDQSLFTQGKQGKVGFRRAKVSAYEKPVPWLVEEDVEGLTVCELRWKEVEETVEVGNGPVTESEEKGRNEVLIEVVGVIKEEEDVLIGGAVIDVDG